MKIPSFSYPGGKARLRSWLCQHFQKSGRTYVEPFAGLGNVFFLGRSTLQFDQWWLNDVNSCGFFEAIRLVDCDQLPDRVDRRMFAALKADRVSPLARVIEPRVTFTGKGYDFGFSGDCGTHVGYRKANYAPMILSARSLLEGVKTTDLPWDRLPFDEFNDRDFVYFDPPYVGTEIGTYGNVDHDRLMSVLVAARFHWVLSGYDNDLYRSAIGMPIAACHRAAEISAANGKKGQRRQECIWSSESFRRAA